jgi:UDP-glucose 4-epimerase
MGISKAMMEKVIVATSKNIGNADTTICITRYGNVLASRGSVVPLFVNQLLNGDDITVTDPNMTRFMMTLDDALSLVLFAFENGDNGEIFVQKAPASTVEIIAKAVKELLSRPDHPIITIGTRHGEKLYESLLTKEEMLVAEDLGGYFKVSPDHRDLNYEKYVEKGNSHLSNQQGEDYNSHNTLRLNLEETKDLLLKVQFMQDTLQNLKSRQ